MKKIKSHKKQIDKVKSNESKKYILFGIVLAALLLAVGIGLTYGLIQ